MAVKFTGDFKKIARWEKKLRQTPKVLPILSKNLAEETIHLIQDGMSRGVDPSGKRYKPLVMRSGTPLSKTGGLKRSWFRKHSSKGRFTVASGKGYSKYHQLGTGIYGPKKSPIKPKRAKALRIPTKGGDIFRKSVKGSPVRKMVPNRRIPNRWRLAYRRTINDTLSTYFRLP